jgi:hypothetical protein
VTSQVNRWRIHRSCCVPAALDARKSIVAIDPVGIMMDTKGTPPVRASAQAPERSGETWGKCPEKARSRSGHALVASWSCTGSCGLSMTTPTP